MSHRPRLSPSTSAGGAFEALCDGLDLLLTGGSRRAIVEACGAAGDLGHALARLRALLQSNRFAPGGVPIDLAADVEMLDQRTRQEGFHVLHDWDGKAVRFNETTIPVDVLDFVARSKGTDSPDLETIGIVLDYHVLHLLCLLSLRLWDTSDPDAALDRLDTLLARLQGPDGSEQQFVSDAATLLLVATAKYEPIEEGYDLLLERVRTLHPRHRHRIALGHAASMGCHLRFGFEAQYARDTVHMRNDNAADYPWLCFAVATLLEVYEGRGAHTVSGHGTHDALVEALFNGLSGDAHALVSRQTLPALSPHGAEQRMLSDRFHAHAAALLAAFEAFRPTDETYSPLGFFFNFSHNVVKGAAVDAMLWGEPWPVSFNALLTGSGAGDPTDEDKRLLAGTLGAYARSAPDTIRGRLMPVIVYDPATGRRAHSVTMQRLRAATD